MARVKNERGIGGENENWGVPGGGRKLGGEEGGLEGFEKGGGKK